MLNFIYYIKKGYRFPKLSKEVIAVMNPNSVSSNIFIIKIIISTVKRIYSVIIFIIFLLY